MSSITVDALLMVDWLQRVAVALHAASAELTSLDAARGDADHGVNMDRGFAAVASHVSQAQFGSAGEVLLQASTVLRKSMGGTSGPLWSAALRRAGKSLETADPDEPVALGQALSAAIAAVMELGGAQEGDNTMVDAFLPAARVFTERAAQGADLAAASRAATEAADAGAALTAMRAATKGRSAYLGSRVIGNVDPGAASAAIVIRALYEAVAARAPQ